MSGKHLKIVGSNYSNTFSSYFLHKTWNEFINIVVLFILKSEPKNQIKKIS